MGDLNDFHARNWDRMHEAFAPPHDLKALVVCVQEEIGELAGAVLGVTGEKARKAHLTTADVLDAVADAITYLSLVARSAGCEDLEALIGSTFNMVSDRAGSKFKTLLGQEGGERRRIRRELLAEFDLYTDEAARLYSQPEEIIHRNTANNIARIVRRLCPEEG